MTCNAGDYHCVIQQHFAAAAGNWSWDGGGEKRSGWFSNSGSHYIIYVYN